MALVRNGVRDHGRRLLSSLLPSARPSLTAASAAFAPPHECQQQQAWGRHYGQQRRSMVLVRKKRERLTVVLDLDECLVHSRFEPRAGRRGGGKDYAHQLPQQDDDDDEEVAGGPAGTRGRRADLGDVRHSHPKGVDFFWLELEEGERVRVNLRPRVDEFLLRLADDFDCVAFTAATEVYAAPVLDRLDPTGAIFQSRFFRDSCSPFGNVYLKDLRVVGRDMARMVLVDNNPVSFLAQPSNGVPVPSFYDDPEDDALPRVADLIDEHLAHADDVRPPLTRLFRLEEQLAPIRRQLRLKGVGDEGKEEEGEEDGLPRSEAEVKRSVPPPRSRR